MKYGRDGKGLKLSRKDETTGQKTEFFLKWDRVACGIADLIDEDKYFTEKETSAYPRVSERTRTT